jgi:hypothetical protein
LLKEFSAMLCEVGFCGDGDLTQGHVRDVDAVRLKFPLGCLDTSLPR